jgi:hypothetical protein
MNDLELDQLMKEELNNDEISANDIHTYFEWPIATEEVVKALLL